MARMRRNQPVRVRLAPPTESAGVEVVLSEAEYAALKEAMERSGYLIRPNKPKRSGRLGLSSFVRDIVTFAAWEYVLPTGKYYDERLSFEEAIFAAAAAASQGPGEWMRVVSLAAVGASDLEQQVALARAAWERGVESWE